MVNPESLVKAVEPVLKLLLDNLGVGGFFGFVILVLFAAGFYVWYKDWRKDREVNLALAAKDQTIQIIAEQNRQYRVLELKEKGLSDEMISAIVLENTPSNPIEARIMLENGKTKSLPKATKDKKR